MAGIEITPEQVVQGITYQALKDKEGNPFVVAVYNLAPSLFPEKYRDLAGPLPLLIAEKGEKGWGWERAHLQDMAALHNMYVSTAGTYFTPAMEKIAREEFSAYVTELDLTWNKIEPEKGKLDQRRISHVRQLMREGKFIIANNLVSWGDYPDWLKTLFPEEKKQALKDHIELVMRAFPEIKVWVIVNEFHDLKYHPDILQQEIGDYRVLAFQTARKVRPDAILLLGDNQNELKGSINHQRNIEFLAQGFADGIAVHLHQEGDDLPTQSQLAEGFRDFTSKGYRLYITEHDINLRNVSISNRLIIQAYGFYIAVKAAIDSSAESYGVWGIQDNQSWLENPNLRSSLGNRYSPNADPLLFDDNFFPKLSYYAVMAAFLR